MNQPGLVAAFAAGLLSFLSPCVLPLVPGYLSFISGIRASGPRTEGKRQRILMRSLAFSGGFTTAFTILGIAFSGGAMFTGGSGIPRFFGIMAGALIFLFGLNMIFNIISFLGREARFHPKGKKGEGNIFAVSGPAGAFVMGLAFAAGWSPCIGPILASILLFAGKTGSLLNASLLLMSYSLGLALPFVAAGFFFEEMKPVMDYMKRRGREIRIVSGILLMAFGMVMAAGSLPEASAITVGIGIFLQNAQENNPLIVRLFGSLVLLMPVLETAIYYFFKNRRKKRQNTAKNGELLRVMPSLHEKVAPPTHDFNQPLNTDSFKKKIRFGMNRIVCSIFVLLAILQTAGIVNFPAIVAGWLLFQGV